MQKDSVHLAVNLGDPDTSLLPCPFCGAGETIIHVNKGIWTGMSYGEPLSIEIKHWCEKVEGQPSRMISRIGRDEASAIAAWNRRTPVQLSAQRQDSEQSRLILEPIPLTEPVTIAKALLAHREATVWLNGGVGPEAMVALCNIGLTGWTHTKETAGSFAKGYNAALCDLRGALSQRQDSDQSGISQLEPTAK